MNRPRLLAAVIVATIATACTPDQLATYQRITGNELTAIDHAALLELPDQPMRLDRRHVITVDGEVTTLAAPGRCAEWYPTAIAAGFTDREWTRLAPIMYRESRCQPSAYNRSGATGLLQIMPMWADDCGGSRADLHDPAFNLACGRHILDTQGWSAWAVR